MIEYLQAHYGLVIAVVTLNICLSAVGSILAAIHKTIPGWFGTVAGYAKKAADYLSANVPH